MDRSTPLTLALLLALGCGGAEVEPPDEPAATAQPSEESAAQDEAETPTPEEATAARDAAALAEAFVREQGYTDVPPTVEGDAIVPEGIEGSVEDRLGTLQPRSVAAVQEGEGEGWLVVFPYAAGEHEGRGRAVRLRAGQSPRLVHQDVVLSAFVD